MSARPTARLMRIVGWPFRALLIAPILVYRYGISPILGPNCRYHPSCSAYGLQAIRHHGPIKGTVMTVRRLLSCHPWSAGGLDPVPDRIGWRDVLTRRHGETVEAAAEHACAHCGAAAMPMLAKAAPSDQTGLNGDGVRTVPTRGASLTGAAPVQ